jgi:hypothetical protein
MESDLLHAKEDISFFGYRYVYIPKFDGKIAIDDFPSRVMSLIRKNFDFDENERSSGKKIASHINKLYEDNDKKTGKKNILTRLFCKVRDFWNQNIKNLGYGTRFDWDSEKNSFEFYTKNQYQKLFNSAPPNEITKIWSKSKCPDRWRAPNIVK